MSSYRRARRRRSYSSVAPGSTSACCSWERWATVRSSTTAAALLRYSGYLDEYRCEGPWPSDTIATIRRSTACASTSRRPSCCATCARLIPRSKRSGGCASDHKARGLDRPVGCGVFRGVPTHKFLQCVGRELGRVTRFDLWQADGCDTPSSVRRTSMRAHEAWKLLCSCDSEEAFESKVGLLNATRPAAADDGSYKHGWTEHSSRWPDSAEPYRLNGCN